jgi:hypothetical protein
MLDHLIELTKVTWHSNDDPLESLFIFVLYASTQKYCKNPNNYLVI